MTKVSILNTEVLFTKEKINLEKAEREFETDLNFVTIASAQPNDIFLSKEYADYQFKETSHIHINFLMHDPIQFELPAMSLKELIWNISKIYVEVFQKFRKEARVCCSGHEFLYLNKINIHSNNIVSLTVSQKIKS